MYVLYDPKTNIGYIQNCNRLIRIKVLLGFMLSYIYP